MLYYIIILLLYYINMMADRLTCYNRLLLYIYIYIYIYSTLEAIPG